MGISVEWSDRSVPVQKLTSGPYVHYERNTIRNSESALASLVSAQPFDMAFLVRWLVWLHDSLYSADEIFLLTAKQVKSLNSNYLYYKESHTLLIIYLPSGS